MTSITEIRFTRIKPGLYVSKCGRYEIARTIWHDNPAHTAWVPYRVDGSGGGIYDGRLTDRYGCRLLADAKAVCQREEQVADLVDRFMQQPTTINVIK
jgi:hypothetical protein